MNMLHSISIFGIGFPFQTTHTNYNKMKNIYIYILCVYLYVYIYDFLIHATGQPSGEWVKLACILEAWRPVWGERNWKEDLGDGSVPIVVPHTQGVMLAGLHSTGQRNEGAGQLKARGDSLVPSGPLAMKTSLGSGVFPIQFVRLLNWKLWFW